MQRRLIYALLLPLVAAAQQGTSIIFTNPKPYPVESGTGSTIGEPGTLPMYYWVVAKYVGGDAISYGPIAVLDAPPPLRLSNLRYVTINWTAREYVTGYDVLRTPTATRPSGACNCAVGKGITALTVNDQSATLQTYTVLAAGETNGRMYVDSLNITPPMPKMIINGADVGFGVGGGGGPGAVSSVFGRTGAVTAQAADYLAFYMPALVATGVPKLVAGTPQLITGLASDCVRVDGSSGACGSGSGGVTLQDEGVSQGVQPIINFTGAGVVVAGGVVSIPGTAGQGNTAIAGDGIRIDQVGTNDTFSVTAPGARVDLPQSWSNFQTFSSGILPKTFTGSWAGTCTTGEPIIKTDGTAGANLYICGAANAIAIVSSGGPGGSLTIQDEGTSQGPATTLNFSGAGVTTATTGGISTISIPGSGSTFLATVSAQTANITHNLNSLYPTITCVNTATGARLVPMSAPVDANHLNLDFGVTRNASCVFNTGATVVYPFGVTSAATITVTGATHQRGHIPLITCYRSSNGQPLSPMLNINTSTFDFSADFGASVTASCTAI